MTSKMTYTTCPSMPWFDWTVLQRPSECVRAQQVSTTLNMGYYLLIIVYNNCATQILEWYCFHWVTCWWSPASKRIFKTCMVRLHLTTSQVYTSWPIVFGLKTIDRHTLRVARIKVGYTRFVVVSFASALPSRLLCRNSALYSVLKFIIMIINQWAQLIFSTIQFVRRW